MGAIVGKVAAGFFEGLIAAFSSGNGFGSVLSQVFVAFALGPRITVNGQPVDPASLAALSGFRAQRARPIPEARPIPGAVRASERVVGMKPDAKAHLFDGFDEARVHEGALVGVVCYGTCLEPEFPDRTVMLIDPDLPPLDGELGAVVDLQGEFMPAIKRMRALPGGGWRCESNEAPFDMDARYRFVGRPMAAFVGAEFAPCGAAGA